MVAWWKRLLFSLGSVVTAVAVCLGALIAADLLLKGKIANIHGTEVGIAVGVTVALCLVGWVITAPLVLIVRKIPAGRFWIYWAFGSCIGPLLMLGLFAAVFLLVPHSPNEHWIRPELLPLVYMAVALSSITSIFYLLLLRRAQTRAAAKLSASVAASGGLI
jgi:drug/metabolite transporter (DMT)-like permease